MCFFNISLGKNSCILGGLQNATFFRGLGVFLGRSWGGLGGILDGLWLSWGGLGRSWGPILGLSWPDLGWSWAFLWGPRPFGMALVPSRESSFSKNDRATLSLSLLAFSFGTPRIHEAHNVQSHELVCMLPSRNRVVITTRLVEKVAARSPFPTPSGSLLHCVQVYSFCLLLRSFVCLPC